MKYTRPPSPNAWELSLADSPDYAPREMPNRLKRVSDIVINTLTLIWVFVLMVVFMHYALGQLEAEQHLSGYCGHEIPQQEAA